MQNHYNNNIEKIKKKYQSNEFNLAVINRYSGEIYEDVIDNRGQERKYINLNFIKKHMLNYEKILKEIGPSYIGYLDYIMQTTLKKNNTIEPEVLVNNNIISKRTYATFIKCMKDNAFIFIKKEKIGKRFILNPYYATKSKTIDKDIISIVKDSNFIEKFSI